MRWVDGGIKRVARNLTRLPRAICLVTGLCLLMIAIDAAAAPCTTPDAKCHVRLTTGIDMAHVEVGPPEGPAVVLVHGLTDSLRSWSLAMAALHRLDPGLHIFAVDQRGHGASSLPPGTDCKAAPERCFRLTDFAADLVAFAAAKGIGHATFVGHSLGSFVVQELALDHPELVERAMLVATSTSLTSMRAPPGGLPEDPLILAWRQALIARGLRYPEDCWALTPLDADPRAATTIARDWDVDPLAPPAFVAAVAAETAHVRLGTWIGATRTLSMADTAERLGRITVPMLVLWGTQDSIFLASDQDRLKASLRQAATRGVPIFWKRYGTKPLPPSGAQEDDIGHNVQWDAPDAVAADILSFIREGRPVGDWAL